MKVKVYIDVSDEHGTTMVSAIGPLDPPQFLCSSSKGYKRYIFEVDVPCKAVDGDGTLGAVQQLAEEDLET
jgi:hypothetical protein